MAKKKVKDEIIEPLKEGELKAYYFDYCGKPVRFTNSKFEINDRENEFFELRYGTSTLLEKFDKVEHEKGSVVFYLDEKVIYTFNRSDMTNILMKR